MTDLHKYFEVKYSLGGISDGMEFHHIRLRKCPFCNSVAGISPSSTETITGFNYYLLGCMNDECQMRPTIDLKIGNTYKFGLQAINKWNGQEQDLYPAIYKDYSPDCYASSEFSHDISYFDEWYGSLIQVDGVYYEPVK